MNINKSNILVIPQTSVYFSENLVDEYMDNDFTLNAVIKLNVEKLETGKESFLFARNGMHSGISIYKHPDTYDKFKDYPTPDIGPPTSILFAHFTYWFTKDDKNYEKKTFQYILDERLIRKTNVYTMINNQSECKIECYFNYELVGCIEYSGYKKINYKNSYYWFGCDNMITDECEKIAFSDFNLDLIFLIRKCIKISEVKDISKNYLKKYTKNFTEDTFTSSQITKLDSNNSTDFRLKILNELCPYKNDFAFLCDFKNITRYKIWNYTFNGIYPIIYMPNNTYF